MARYGRRSTDNLKSAHPDLQRVFNVAIKIMDNSIICGHRDKADQDEAFESGRSKVQYPGSKHNSNPSNAVDAIPYPIDWNDVNRMRVFAGIVFGVAYSLGIKIRWGGDWDMDMQVKDNRFNDMPHFELIDV